MKKLKKHLAPIAPTYRLKTISALIASLTFLTSPLTYAADDKVVTELQEEVARLKQELSKAKQELTQEKSGNVASENTSQTTNAPQDSAKQETVATEDTNVLDSLVVTNRLKSPLEKVADKSASISIVSGEELNTFQATNVTEVLRRVGNVNFNYGNPRTGSLTLRGITTGSSDQISPTVGVQIDGVGIAYTPLANGYIFTDIDTVDVTRGPQGTTGGLSSNVGRITFKTNAPTFQPVAKASQTYGEWHTLKTQAVLGGPIVDDLLAWRGSFVREQQDGPFKEQFRDLEGRLSYQNTDRTFGRIQFLLTPTENFSAKVSYELQPKGSEFQNGNTVRHPEPLNFSNGTPRLASSVDSTYKRYVNRSWFNQAPNVWNPATDYFKYMTNTDNNGAIITSSEGLTGNLYWSVLGHELQSITGWRNHWFSAANDEGTPYDITKSGGYITGYKQLSQEFRINSIKDDKSLVDYQAGLIFLKTDNDSFGSRTRYGNDAGASLSNDTLYGSLNSSAAGQALLRDSLNLAYRTTNTIVENKSIGVNASADWHLSEPLTLTTGYAVSYEERNTKQGLLLIDPGVGADLTTAFGDSATTTGIGTSAAATAAASRLYARYFGGDTSAANTNLLRDAARVRNGTLQQSSLYPITKAKPWKGDVHTANFTLTDKINEDITVYGSLQYGEKAGIAQVNAGGASDLIDKERTTAFEFGVRTSFLNNDLLLNANTFISQIKDFQTTVNNVDVATTNANIASGLCTGADCQAFISQVGNVPKVRVKGVEVDATYNGIDHFSFRVAAAYNDSRYADDTYLAFRTETNTTGIPANRRFYNANGDTLLRAPKFTGNLSAGYTLPVFGDKLFHANANYNFTSSYYTSTSEYDVVDAYGLLDLAIGLGRKDGLFDANLLVKNAFDKKYNPEGFASYTPTLPRWVGIVFSSKL